MRTPLANGTVLHLNEIGTSKGFDFKIEEMIGMGGSCIVYTAVFIDAENNRFPVRLKELYPEWLDLNREGNTLSVPEEKTADFSAAMQQFTDGYKKQMQFREQPESMNSIANIQGIYEGNGTKYIAMSCQNAVPIPENLSLYDIFRVIRAVTLQIANFHDNGYLYLDLKPQNVMLYPETPEMVMLFDFDSAMPMGDIQPAHLSCTDAWAAPEVLQRKYHEIDAETDIYGIGALLLYLLFHRVPGVSDRRRGASWDTEIAASILNTEKPEIKRIITEILSHTLAANPKKRYASCDDLLDVIEPLIAEYQKPKPYLKTFLPMGNNFFCGRDTEIAEIHNALAENDLLILHGIGGIGKSELAKHYAQAHFYDYDAAVFVRFQGNIQDTVIMDSNFPVVNCTRSDEEDDAAYFERKIKVLQEICTERHLLILDNFDTDDCDNLDALTGLPCRILITSRVDYSDTFPQYEVDVLDSVDALRSIITYYFDADLDEAESDAIDNIISAVQGHTMALELIGKHMTEMEIAPSEMYNLLAEKGITASNDGKVRGFKDGNLKSRAAYAHIAALFNIFGLSEEMKQILRCAALVGPNLISLSDFIFCSSLSDEQIDVLQDTVCRGWIQHIELENAKNDIYFLLHPLIADVLCEELKPDVEQCEDFIVSAADMTEEICNYGHDERRMTIQWLEHTAHTIRGNSPAITMFLDDLASNIYWQEHEYNRVQWCHERIIQMIYDMNEHEHYKLQLLNSYLYLRNICVKDGDSNMADGYSQKIRELATPAALSYLAEQECDEAIQSGNYELAFDVSQERLRIALERNQDEYLARAYYQLGQVESAFEHEAAHDYYVKAASYMENVVRERETEEDILADELAICYRDAGDMNIDADQSEKALEYYRKALEVYNREYGKDNTNSATVYTFIYYVYLKLRQPEKQIETLKKAVSIFEKVYGAEHEESIKWNKRLYHVYMDLWYDRDDADAVKEAAALAEKLVDAVSEVYGTKSLYTAGIYQDCAIAFRYAGEQEKCYYYSRLSVSLYEALLEENDDALIAFYRCAADDYTHFHDCTEAKELLRKASAICEAVCDDDQLAEIRKEIAEMNE